MQSEKQEKTKGALDEDIYDFEDYDEDEWKKLAKRRGVSEPTREIDPKFRKELIEQGVDERDIGYFAAEFDAAHDDPTIHAWATLCDKILTEESTPERQDEGAGRKITHKGVMDFFFNEHDVLAPLPSGKVKTQREREELRNKDTSILTDLWILIETEGGLVPAMESVYRKAKNINETNVGMYVRKWFNEKRRTTDIEGFELPKERRRRR